MERGEYPGWMKVVLEHPVDVVLLRLAGCGLRNLDRQEASPGLSSEKDSRAVFFRGAGGETTARSILSPTRKSQSWNSSGFPCN